VNAPALLRLEQVACIRGGRLLFEGLDLSLHPGEAAVAIGPNGAGKSSLLRLAAGLLRAAAGLVERDAAAALADENLALDPKQSLGHALAFWARIDGTDPAPGISAMGLSGLADVPVRMLSTGQRKRAVLTRVISSNARIWLLDEPTNGLDSEGLERLGAAMAAHRAGGGVILTASHQPLALPSAREVALG
jgi:heme exporter protein A